jgi:hypothetical protein
MCYTCGCKRPYDDMGSSDNIIEGYFEKAGQTDAIKEAGKMQAKQNMLELLKLELEDEQLERPQQQY